MASRGRKVLIGCAVGCGTLVLLSVGSCIGFVAWLNAPGDVIEPTRLIEPATTGYVAWTLRLEDPGTEDFVRQALETMRRTRDRIPSPLPSWIQDPLTAWQQRSDERKLRRLFPVVLAWTLHPGELDAGQDVHLLSASLSGADHGLRLADWMLRLVLWLGDDGDVLRCGNDIVLKVPMDNRPPGAFFIHGGDLFFAGDTSTACRAIDRLQSSEASPEPPVVGPWLARVPERPLRGAIANADGALERVWRAFDPAGAESIPDEAWSGLAALTLAGELKDGSLMGAAVLHFTNPAAREATSDAFVEAAARLVDGSLVELTGTEAVGSRLRLTLEVADITGRLRGLAEDVSVRDSDAVRE